MPDDRSVGIELAKALQETQVQLQQTMSDLAQVRTEFRALARVVSSAENERSLMQRVWVLEREVKDLSSEASKQRERNWQIKMTLGIACLGLVSSVVSPIVTRMLSPASPPPEEHYFPPGPGESSNSQAQSSRSFVPAVHASERTLKLPSDFGIATIVGEP